MLKLPAKIKTFFYVLFTSASYILTSSNMSHLLSCSLCGCLCALSTAFVKERIGTTWAKALCSTADVCFFLPRVEHRQAKTTLHKMQCLRRGSGTSSRPSLGLSIKLNPCEISTYCRSIADLTLQLDRLSTLAFALWVPYLWKEDSHFSGS